MLKKLQLNRCVNLSLNLPHNLTLNVVCVNDNSIYLSDEFLTTLDLTNTLEELNDPHPP